MTDFAHGPTEAVVVVRQQMPHATELKLGVSSFRSSDIEGLVSEVRAKLQEVITQKLGSGKKFRMSLETENLTERERSAIFGEPPTTERK